jgi:predicted metal-dependent hydrolase
MSDVTHPPLAFVVEEDNRRRQASARLRGNRAIISLPKKWPLRLKDEAAAELKTRMAQLYERQCKQLAKFDAQKVSQDPEGNPKTLNIQTLEQLQRYVQRLNAESYQVPLKGVRMGWAKYSRLAQANLRTGVITISKYCLGADIPEDAFRYLVLHELAHFIEANHSPRFWNLVARFCPDYKVQQRIIRLYFQRQQVAVDA